MSTPTPHKACLIVIDGWGIAPPTESNAIFCAPTPAMNSLAENHLAVPVAAHGLAVGLPDGVMGNSEVGHLTIGAGRIDFQDLERINGAIKDGSFAKNPRLQALFDAVKAGTGRLHLMGLVSDGGVHSHINHLKEILRAAKAANVPECYLHFFADGRDTAPTSAAGYLADIEGFMANEVGYGRVATIVGRYFAMDRDKRWDRYVLFTFFNLPIPFAPLVSSYSLTHVVYFSLLHRIEIAYNALVSGAGATIVADSTALAAAVADKYASGENDEFFKPVCVSHGAEPGSPPKGCVADRDGVLFFDFRADRMREIASVFGTGVLPFDKPGKTPPSIRREGLNVVQFTQYDSKFPMPVLFPPNNMRDGISEWLSKQGARQFHTAETEKYAHVTFFFNGGIEADFPGEDRGLVPSPQVATYDLQPQMNASGVADSVIAALEKREYDFVICNFAPPDMVGHTIMLPSAIAAAAATDAAVGRIAAACAREGYSLVVTADHGNCEQMRNASTGEPHTAHTANPVPLLVQLAPELATAAATDADGAIVALGHGGGLQDVAPTVLDLMGVAKPDAMTGNSLLVRKSKGDTSKGDSSSKGVSAADTLTRAAAHGDLESVSLLLAPLSSSSSSSPSSSDVVNAPSTACSTTTHGLTPLAAAAAAGHTDVIAALLAAGADVNAFSGGPDGVCLTPLMAAAACGHAAAVTALASAPGVDLAAARACDGATVLTVAATRGDEAVLRALLAAATHAGADVAVEVNKRDGRGWTPLMLAALAGSEGAVRVLLDAGADPAAVTEKGETAGAWAARTGRGGAIEALKEAEERAKTVAQ